MIDDPRKASGQNALDWKALRRAVDRAAPIYRASAAFAEEIGARQLERLDLVRITPARILDLGCGPGTHATQLATRYPESTVIALDLSEAMLAQAIRAEDDTAPGWTRAVPQWLVRAFRQQPDRISPLCADFTRLPIAPRSIDLLWSNLALVFADDLSSTLRDLAQVMRPHGLLMISLLGPDTLIELRRALAALHRVDRTLPFPDMHDVGDWLVQAGFADPVIDCERVMLEYTNAQTLWSDVRALAAVTPRRDRARGLTTARVLTNIERELRAQDRVHGTIRLTMEVIYAHAWKGEPKTLSDGRSIVRLQPRGIANRGRPEKGPA